MAAPRFIYHILTESEWQSKRDNEVYTPESLEHEGFIHCSRLEQLNATIKRFFKDKRDLRVLKIDTALLNVPLIYEAAENGSGFFPHIFGSITLEAVTEVVEPPFKFP
jgi:uncharacterized protein (DUF952 family)